MPFFSVIIPVYNVENTLNECVDSVLRQTYSDYELILVDDGSQDESKKICDSYSRQYGFIRTIHKENGGLSDARNVGIINSTGQYLLFLDSDDYWDDENALAMLSEKVVEDKTPDIIVFGATLLYSDGSKKVDKKNYPICPFGKNVKDELSYLIKNELIIGSACTKVIKRSFLEKEDLYFKVGIRSEDIEWILRVSAALPRYTFLSKYFYIYRKGREGSITSTIDCRHLQEYQLILRDACENKTWNPEIKEILLNYVSYQYIVLCAHVANLKNYADREKLISELKSMQYLLTYDLNPKVKKIKILHSILGYRLTVYALGKYLKFR